VSFSIHAATEESKAGSGEETTAVPPGKIPQNVTTDENRQCSSVIISAAELLFLRRHLQKSSTGIMINTRLYE